MVVHNSSTKGRIGEYFVAYHLEKHGIETSIVDRTGTDLFCRRPSGEMFSVEVKSAIKGVLPYPNAKTPRMNFNIKNICSDWFAFVDLTNELVVFKPRSELEGYANHTFYLSPKEFSPFEMKKTLQLVKGFDD